MCLVTCERYYVTCSNARRLNIEVIVTRGPCWRATHSVPYGTVLSLIHITQNHITPVICGHSATLAQGLLHTSRHKGYCTNRERSTLSEAFKRLRVCTPLLPAEWAL